MSKTLSVPQIQSMLKKRTGELAGLRQRQKTLQRQLAGVEQQIAKIAGNGRGRGFSYGPRPKNERSLSETIFELLGKTKKGFPLAEIAERVLAGGYKTKSSDFKNVVYQCLYNAKEIEHDPETGTYRLKERRTHRRTAASANGNGHA